MKILLVANFSTPACGFRNYADQMLTALRRAGVDVTPYDGTYPEVYARHQEGSAEGFFPADVLSYDVVHLIWHPATLNHYSGANFTPGPIYSLWNGHPFAGCPFIDQVTMKWAPLPTKGHLEHFYPIVDWVEDLPEPDPEFTLGLTGVRREGFGEVQEVADRYGWKTNLRAEGVWLPIEDEIRRLARSTVNVAWYSPVHPDRSGGVMTSLASGRPQLVSHAPMFEHFLDREGEWPLDLYHAPNILGSLDATLRQIHHDWERGKLLHPVGTRARFTWSRAVEIFLDAWSHR